MRKHSTPGAFAKRFLSFAIAFCLTTLFYNAYAQCSIAAETSPNVVTPVGCGNGTVSLGSGAFTTISIQPNTCYSFSWSNIAADICGFCATSNGSGGNFTTNQASWNSGSSTTLTLSSNRCSTTWSGTSGVMTYRYVAPTGVTASVSPNPVCIGTTVSLSSTANCTTSFSWSGPNGYSSASQNPSRLISSTSDGGIYTVSASNNGCVTTANTSSLTVNTPPTATISVTESSGLVNNDGITCSAATITLTANPSGMTLYAWDNGLGNGQVKSPAPTGTTTYGVTVTSTNNCTASASTTITVNPVPAATIGVTESSGTANNDGITCSGATVTLTAGPAGLPSYSWNNGLGSGQVQNPAPTTTTVYNVTVTNLNNCSASATTTISVNPLPTPTITVTESSGTANNDGTTCAGDPVTLTANPAGMTFYSWNNGLGSGQVQTPSPLGTTTYVVTVTNNNACSASASTTITVNPAPSPTIVVTETSGTTNNDGIICAGDNVNLNAQPNGLSSYSWSNGLGSGQSKSVNPGGTTTYTVTVSNGNNCSAAASTTISVNPLPNDITPTAQAASVCPGSATNILIAGSQVGVNYQLRDNSNNAPIGGAVAGNGGTISLPTGNLSVATTFNVLATSTANCSLQMSNTVTVTINALPNGSINGTTSICFGTSATLTFNFNSGTGPYDVSYTDGTNTFNLSGISSGATVSVSPASTTTYTFSSITDANGCIRTSGFTAGAVVSVTPLPVISSVVPTDVLCHNGNTGTITINATSGTPPFTYSIDNGGTFQSSNVFTGLDTGDYYIVVQDVQGCTRSYLPNFVTLNQPTDITQVDTTVDASCSSVFDGQIGITASGGVPPYQYSLNGGPTQAGSQFTGLGAGNYVVYVYDSHSCVDTNSVTINSSYNVVAVLDSQTNVSCFGGSNGAIYTQLTGGIPPYVYSINGGGFGPSGTFTGLAAGTYVITMRDSKGCTDYKTVTISQPGQMAVNIDSVVNAGCYGSASGGIYISVTGGTPSYTYSWSNGVTTEDNAGIAAGSYIVTVTDSHGCTTTGGATVTQPLQLSASIASYHDLKCFNDLSGSIDISVGGGVPPYAFNWSNSATTEDLSGVAAGPYSVTITDANGCSTMLSQTLGQPSQLTSGISATSIGCNGGTANVDLSPSGGTTPYSFFWNNGSATEDLTGVGAGTYSVIITDAHSCTAFNSVTITQPTALALSVAITNINCNGGSTGAIDLTVSGGSPTYSYAWSNSATTEDLSAVAAGTYTVTVTDGNSCTATISGTITQPAQAMSTTLVATDVTCNGAANGSIDLTVNGGTTPYTYSWDNSATTQDISGLSPGTYSVTVSDVNGCQGFGSATVNQPSVLSASIVGTNVTCNGGNDGAADLTVTGGNGGYTYLWSNFSITEDQTGLTAGNYVVIVTDSKGCQTFASVTITQNPAMNLSGVVTNVSCNGGNNGAIDITATGGAAPLSYSWSNLSSNEDQTGLTVGSYSVSVTDNNGCSVTGSFNVTQPTALNASIASVSNVSCNGGSNGFIYVTVSGGVTSYSYAWSNGSTSQNLVNVPAGTYTVTITDANGCTAQLTQAVTEPAALTASIAAGSIACSGGSANVDLTVSGGTTNYSYFWNSGATTEDLTGVGPGTYTVLVTDAHSCTATASTTITAPAPISVTGVVTNIACNGAGSGAIDITVTGGSGSYSYAWSNSATTEDLSGLSAGTYSVTVNDGSCTATASFTITQPANALSLSTVVTDAGCNGSANGSINLTVTGGVQPYSYLWSNAATTEDITGLAIGTYTVSVTDANGCSSSASATVSQPAVLSASIAGTNVTCFGGNDGAADLSVSGGTAPYNYFWSTFEFTQDISGLTAGNYVVIVTDAHSCQTYTNVTITQPAQIAITGTTFNLTCNGSADGAIDISVTGGTGAYGYSWSNGATTQDLTGLAAGTYTVTVLDASVCSATASFTITQPAAITIAGVSTNVSCNGGNNGAVDITPSGGTTPYTYDWSNGATTQDVNGLGAGLISVVVTDANFCTAFATYTITQPTAITTSIAATNVTCHGASDGAADLTVSGGTPGYTYLWSTFNTTQDLNNISGGTYFVIVTDSHGCQKTDSVTITEAPQLVLSVSVTNAGCNGGNGAVDLTVSGGAPSYTYAWSNSATTQDLASVAAGTYTVTVTDANNCSASISAIVTQPTAITAVVASFTNVSCAGAANGSINISVNGGVTPYSYAWSNSSTLEDLVNIGAGTYTVTITDANGCSATLSQTITAPVALSASVTATTITCNGGTANIDLTVSGGTTPYSYFWNNGVVTQDQTGVSAGSYSVIVTDANSCTANAAVTITQPAAINLSVAVTNVSCNGGNGAVDLTATGGTGTLTYAWSNSATTQDLASVPAGTYSVTVTDVNACSASISATVTQPTALTLTAQVFNVNCSGGANGSINITVAGGVQPYTYNWGGGVTVEDRFALAAGAYTVTATDANSCTISQTYNITEPSAITSAVVATDVSCAGAANGSADLTVSGGTSPYTFSWSNFQVSEDLTGLGGGTYYVSITDANGCTHRDSAIIAEPTAIVLTTAVTNIGCNGNNSGAIDLTVSGGTPNYTYAWSNSATTQDLSGIGQGTYTVTVTDASSCTASTSATITQPNALVLSASVLDVSCAGGNNGSVNLTVSGGVIPYSFNWSNSATTEDIINLTAGTYDVTVTDNNTCSATASYVVNEPTPIVSSVVGTNVLCQGANNGSADLTVSGGTQPYTFLWSNFQGSEDIQNLDGGIYYVLITDASGCIHRDSVIIQEPSPLILSTVVTNITCFNANNGSIDLTVQGGTSNYSYAWSNSATTQDLNNLPGGTYVVTVTDANTCTAVTSAIIVNPSAITANFIVHNTLCNGSTDGSVDMIPTGGTPPYTFNWSNGATTEDINNLAAGTYNITITDTKGCIKVDSVVITEPAPLVTSGFIRDVTCAGYHDGFIDITGYGGTLPYNFEWSTNQSTEDIGSLPGGNYFVTVTDVNGCQVASLYIVNEPAPLTLNLVGTNPSCSGSFNGTVSCIPGGGTTPYQYLWEDFHTDSSRAGLAAGYYAVMLTDSSGCMVIDSIDLIAPAPITISGVVTNVGCFGASTGAIDLTAGGGTGTLGFNWSNSATTEDITGLAAGNYNVTVTDANSCSGSAGFTVTQPLAISLSTVYTNPGCYGANNGSVSVIAVQGVAPYTYLWNTAPLQTTASAQNLTGGTFSVTVTDANGCTATTSQTLTQPDSIAVSANSIGAKCFNTATGQVIATVTGGQLPLVYELNGMAQASNTFTNLLPGNYVILVTDANGCEGTTGFTVADASQITVDLSATQQVIATGMQTTLVANATSTSPIQNYIWSPDSVFDFSGCGDPLNCNNPLVQPLTSTIFTVTVMNEDSCFASDTITIYVSGSANKFTPSAFTPNGDGLNDYFELDVLGASNLEVSIYNRWGERFYYNPSQVNGIGGAHGWDGNYKGKPAPEDTYVYKVKVTYFDNVTSEFEGTITLMR